MLQFTQNHLQKLILRILINLTLSNLLRGTVCLHSQLKQIDKSIYNNNNNNNNNSIIKNKYQSEERQMSDLPFIAMTTISQIINSKIRTRSAKQEH